MGNEGNEKRTSDVTPEMIAAGRQAFHREWLNSDAYDATEMLVEVYRAMKNASAVPCRAKDQ